MEKHLLNVNVLTEVLIFVKTNLMFACFLQILKVKKSLHLAAYIHTHR